MEQNRPTTFGHLAPPQATSLLSNQLLYTRASGPSSHALHPVPEEEEDEEEGPSAKRQRVEPSKCAACHKEYKDHKSLLRHRRRCKPHCAESNIPPESYPCDECGQVLSRLDVLRRHVQTAHRGQQRRRSQRPESATQSSPGNESQPQSVHSTTTRSCVDQSISLAEFNRTILSTNASSYSETDDTVGLGSATGDDQMVIDSQVLMTPAKFSDLESSGYAAVSGPDGWTPDQSIVDYQGTSASDLSTELTPATSKLSPASFVNEVATLANRRIDEDAELAALADDVALAAAVERQLSLLDVPYPSVKPASQGRNLRPRRIDHPTPCPLCGYEFGYALGDDGKVKPHLERHRNRIEAIASDTVSDSEASCTDCQIHFLDTRDLVGHQQSVQFDRGCGFTFNHYGKQECSGHHPRTIGGQMNPDHDLFTKSLRKWEGLKRCAFEEYVEAYAQGLAPTNAPPYESDKPTYRRSTGSIIARMSLRSVMSSKSTPARYLYGEEMEPKSTLVTRNARKTPAGLAIRGLAKAFANEQYDLVTKLCSKRLFSFLAISDEDLSVKMDASWFYPDPNIERVRCLCSMVELGLKVSESSIEHLVTAFEEPAAQALLFVKSRPVSVHSRLAQYAFLYAISQGLVGAISPLLCLGILGTTSEIPDADFIQGLQKSSIWDRTNSSIGQAALVLALNTRQYSVANLLLMGGVSLVWGVSHLAKSKQAMQDFQDELLRFRQMSVLLPPHLESLEDALLGEEATSISAMLAGGLI